MPVFGIYDSTFLPRAVKDNQLSFSAFAGFKGTEKPAAAVCDIKKEDNG